MLNPAGTQPLPANALVRVLSQARLESYRRGQGDSLRVLIGRYRWNVALSAALYPPLFHLEVAFRNGVHQALTHLVGQTTWYEVSAALLLERELSEVANTRRELLAQRQRKRRTTNVTIDDMVAALNFGFWTSLLSGSYDQVLWNKRDVWARAFPHLPRRGRTRVHVSGRMHSIRQLRNRVFHHEPIWHSENLLQQYRELQETITWFEPTLLGLLPNTHTFEEVHARGPAAYELDVQ
jgi:hypothetical protein